VSFNRPSFSCTCTRPADKCCAPHLVILCGVVLVSRALGATGGAGVGKVSGDAVSPAICFLLV
jgi:hypothetical protein